ncbi:transposase-like protein [Pochonia chlamydosporia 170]|uniref:Transposase-like protein n=1 Tax=Pochonia chlamydosporia 170 TaxID=1380566 RepID=A0A179EWV5_METCM|nr:transposase-like protein [Pochonia chlamydosporia 170]OAQ57667.2 transposase-like protein [Pochonia chlamydosporia 170]
MSFHLSAEDIRVEDDHILKARLQTDSGEWNDAEFDLNEVLGNHEGVIHWDGRDFASSVKNITFSMEGDSQVPILRVVLRTIDGDELPSDVNLAERIGNENGVFVYVEAASVENAVQSEFKSRHPFHDSLFLYLIEAPTSQTAGDVCESHLFDKYPEGWTVEGLPCSLPFAQVEHPAFRDLIRYLRPAADDLLPRSGDTVKTDLQWGYDNKKEFVKRALQNALSSIHIIPDNWASPNGLGVIGFTVQFVTEDHGLQSLVVRIKELEGEHSGEHMAEAIMEFIREYGIATKVGYFMMDNASNMNTMIDKVSDELEQEFDVFYDPLPHRLRCTGHIINLAVMEFLIGKRPRTTGSYGGPSEEEIGEWRKRGAIGKLHNIVVYVTWTPQRLQTFTVLTDGLRLRRDNDTRWNSWYHMVERALRPKVRQAITVFCAQEPALQEDTLTPSDWVTLAEIHKFLEPFHDATMANEGVQNSIADVLPTMDYLLHHIEAAREATTIPHLATMMETAWAKLADYYELTEDSPVYSAATVLNPSFKWAYMEKTWEDKTEWIERAKSRVGQLWRESYKSSSYLPVLRPGSAEEPTTRRLNGYKMWMNEQKATIFNTDDDEYEVYCREPVVMTPDPLKWWLEVAQRRRFPSLSLMAIDILSIAAMSSGTERLFSKLKLTVTDQRGAIDAETLNIVECLRSWDSSALIVPSDCRYVDAASGFNHSDALGREESGGGLDTVEIA